MRYLSIAWLLVVNTAFGNSYSIDENGVNSKITGLNGSGIEIGMLEQGRSGKAGFDNNMLSSDNTFPVQVYVEGMLDGPNNATSIQIGDFHATQVAQVAIGRAIPQGLYEGVAPQANLYSNGVDAFDGRDVAQGFEFLARLGGPMVDVKAINASFAIELGDPLLEIADGNSHITQYLDWSSREYDLLYSIGWSNAEDPARRAMVDSYNNIVVASSDSLNDQTATYSKFAAHNNTEGRPVGERAGIHILAPGTFMRLRAPVGAPGNVGGEWNPTPH